jgi:GntR family carbon starvation induced transcriptional regulator
MVSIRERTVSLSSQTEEAVVRLRGDIVEGRLLPGRKLPIQDLVEQLHFSPGAVREALSRLTAEGFVSAQPQKGFRVAGISEKELRDVTATRIHIETLAIREAIEHGKVSWEGKVIGALHELAHTPKIDAEGRSVREWAVAHQIFHAVLVEPCPNECLLDIRAMLFEKSERYRKLCLETPRLERDIDVEHKAIADAVIDRDADHACQLVADHLLATMSIVVNSIKARFGEETVATNGKTATPEKQ